MDGLTHLPGLEAAIISMPAVKDAWGAYAYISLSATGLLFGLNRVLNELRASENPYLGYSHHISLESFVPRSNQG